tara:strand:- start:145 stop:660 length:516 start_codon:yes stop_codon:yes gene_type:complete
MTKKKTSQIMPDEWTGEIPERGRCKECDKFCRIYTDLADVLYLTVTESTSVKLNRRNTHEMSHIRNCEGHAPTKSLLAKHPDIEWDLQIRAFYIMVRKPIYEKRRVKKETTIWVQPKWHTPDGVRTGKKRRKTTYKYEWEYVQVGYEDEQKFLRYDELPPEYRKHHLFCDE